MDLKLTKQQKQKIADSVMNELYHAVTHSDGLVGDAKGRLILDGKLLPDHDRNVLVGQAKAIKDMHLLKILLRDLKNIACKRMYESSQSFDDLMFGKAMLYSLDVIEKKLEKLASLK